MELYRNQLLMLGIILIIIFSCSMALYARHRCLFCKKKESYEELL